MPRVQVRWSVTETHMAVIEVDDVDDIPDAVLAEHECNETYQDTPERCLLEAEEVE